MPVGNDIKLLFAMQAHSKVALITGLQLDFKSVCCWDGYKGVVREEAIGPVAAAPPPPPPPIPKERVFM